MTNIKKNNIIDEVIERRYWSIGEVSIKLNVPASRIRFWEKYFNYRVHRHSSRPNRYFLAEDITFFKKVQELIEKERFTLEGARMQLIKLNLLKDDSNQQG